MNRERKPMPGLMLLMLLMPLAPGSGWTSTPDDGRHTEHAAPAPPPTSRGQVLLPSGRLLEVEVADTPEARQRGYMFREKVSDTEGMIFMMEEVGFHPFWMKNCKVALDILWLDDRWQVVHLERNLPPCEKDPCPSYPPMQASLYVLETQAGLAAREGIKLGDHIIYTPPRPRPRR